jgi:predicted amidohydrolase YtcJ
MRAPYADDPTVSGELDFRQDQIRGILTDALQRNHQLLIHAVGDRAAEALLQAMEATGGQATWSGRRLRIEHGDGLMPDLVPRAKALGVVVAQNPTHFGGDLRARRFGAERASRMLPFRSLLEAGVSLVIATDGGPDDDLSSNPYENIRLASTYQDRPDDAITREQALTAFTRTAAYSEFAERDRGTLEPGTLADLAVLSQNIFSVPDEALPKTESVLTMVGGEIVYRSPLVASVDPLTPPAAVPASDTGAFRATDEVLESRRFSLFDLF